MASEIRVTNIKANDGTSSLTVANSTGNVSVGGTLTSTGAITASGGIANAGAISAGTIGGSVIFPAGHILQVVNATLTNLEPNETARTAETVVANATNQITITSGNKVLVYGHVTLKGVASSNCITVARIRKGTDTSGTILSEIQFMDNSTSSVFHTPHAMFALDDSPADTTPDYTITMLRGSGGTSSVQLYSNSSTYLKIILMEVKG